MASELRERARVHIAERNEKLTQQRKDLGVADDVAAMEGLTPEHLVALGEKGVKTLDDLGDLAGDELVEILGAGEMDAEAANAIIMKAREHWFADEGKN